MVTHVCPVCGRESKDMPSEALYKHKQKHMDEAKKREQAIFKAMTEEQKQIRIAEHARVRERNRRSLEIRQAYRANLAQQEE